MEKKDLTERPHRLKRTPVVYLAGGMRSNWQDRVMEAIPGAIYIDPRRHAVQDEASYTAWDIKGVETADIVFGFIERGNPSGAGLATEFGFAYAKGKTLVYVEEKEFPYTRYFGMVRSLTGPANSHTTLEDGIEALRSVIDSEQY